MRLNADFRRTAVVVAADARWQPSPEPGVERLMLDRIGAELARATSLVRYAAGSSFAPHVHAKGEEFLVLAGVFSDESGNYPAGTYVRNPPGSSHAPSSAAGCRILVKLRQFDDADRRHCVIDTNDARLWRDDNTLPLHEFGSERVAMRRLADGESWQLDPADAGTEMLVVAGALARGPERYPAESWLRFPPGSDAVFTADGPTRLWVKTGHLAGSS